MCRLLGYIGEPISLGHVLFDTDSSLVRQSYSPRMMATYLNLAGFGMAAWDPRTVRREHPVMYRTTTLPAFDRNLRSLAAKLAPTCLIARVRGVTYAEREIIAETSLHPFRFPGTNVALAHNGHLREFERMCYTCSST
jgi:glutamine amidotransferase